MIKDFYKGYEIRPTPEFLTESEEWSSNLHILIHKENEVVDRQFSAADTYKSKEEAIEHCINFGRQIIDGNVNGCTVTDL